MQLILFFPCKDNKNSRFIQFYVEVLFNYESEKVRECGNVMVASAYYNIVGLVAVLEFVAVKGWGHG
jgi:hypothetical protein